jgi:N-acetylmuramoyl-L-alanine amidase
MAVQPSGEALAGGVPQLAASARCRRKRDGGSVIRRTTPFLIGLVLAAAACTDMHHIVIDPGHGGADPGAIGSTDGVLEKDVALRTGLALRDQLAATGRYQVIMTRDEDRFVPLPDRLQIARQGQGELLISLHADSLVIMPEVSGAAIYTLAESAAVDGSAPLAAKENRSAILARIDLSGQEDFAPEISTDLARRKLAELLMQELNGATRMARRRPVEAGFVVLRSADMPSVLIELGYLSNPADEHALAGDARIARLAAAIARAVDAYFGAGPS